MDAVTCVSWVPRGIAKRRPDKVKLSGEDLAQLVKRMGDTTFTDREECEEAGDTDQVVDGTRKRKRAPEANGVSDSHNDEEQEGEDRDSEYEDVDSEEDKELPNPLALSNITVFSDSKSDPYLTNTVDSDEEDEEILPDENLIVVGRMKKEFCNLEVYVYNESEGTTWCHHEILLPNIPLCMDIINHDWDDGKPGNLVALGTLGPDIEIWDIDLMESLEPAVVLHGKSVDKGKMKKKKKAHKGHSDAVLGLSWNRNLTHILASASADCTLGLWDLDKATLSNCIPHGDKVQAVQWNPTKASVLLTGTADHTVNMFDCKSMEPSKVTWEVDGEVESVLWNTENEDQFFACTDSGSVFLYDTRMSKRVFQLHAHTKDVTGMALSASIKGCLLTTGADGAIKVWDVRGAAPRHVSSKELDFGQLFCCASCPDVGHVFVVGGQCELKVMNMKRFAGVVQYFEMADVAGQELSEEFEQVNPGDDDDDNSDYSDTNEATIALKVDDEKAQILEQVGHLKKKQKKKKKKRRRPFGKKEKQGEAAAAENI